MLDEVNASKSKILKKVIGRTLRKGLIDVPMRKMRVKDVLGTLVRNKPEDRTLADVPCALRSRHVVTPIPATEADRVAFEASRKARTRPKFEVEFEFLAKIAKILMGRKGKPRKRIAKATDLVIDRIQTTEGVRAPKNWKKFQGKSCEEIYNSLVKEGE